jgi:hypothetical protein
MIYRRDGRGKEIEPIPLNNEFRALCQTLDGTDAKTLPYSALATQVGKLAHQLDLTDQVERPAIDGPRRMDEMLASKLGTTLLDLGVLRVLEIPGREKALRLCPPAT